MRIERHELPRPAFEGAEGSTRGLTHHIVFKKESDKVVVDPPMSENLIVFDVQKEAVGPFYQFFGTNLTPLLGDDAFKHLMSEEVVPFGFLREGEVRQSAF